MAGTAAIAHIEGLLAHWTSMDLTEADTFWRVQVMARIDAYRLALSTIAQAIPDIEDEAREPMVADDPSDPSIPFVWAGAA